MQQNIRDELQKISRRLDVLIKLNALNAVREYPLREQVKILWSIGFEPKAIAEIVGKSANHVRVMLVQIRKGGD